MDCFRVNNVMKMVSNHCVKVLVNKEQLTRLKTDASNKGFITLSAYIRDLAFNKTDYMIDIGGIEDGRT